MSATSLARKQAEAVASRPRHGLMAEREKQWTAYWAPKMCSNDGTQSEIEFNASVLREKQLWWLQTFNEPYLPLKYPVLFGCPSCDKLFPTRRTCNIHIESVHDAPISEPEALPTGIRLMLSMGASLSKPERAKLLFHPDASERELKICLFTNLPWQDKAMLSPLTSPDDMDLCYTTKTLVLRAEADGEAQEFLSAW